ncbi:Alpha-N-acetylglucosaminidase [Gryllus bimaculatus]|nr:Alpha-N-acetylglucosaminidase [Gryllus bimaculatus]
MKHVILVICRIFPDVNMTRMNTWNEFLDRYCCPYLLEPTEPLFRRVGNMFITELIAEFGTDHFYNCDTFNEMVPQSEDLVYLRNVGAAIFEAISYVDPQAIWLLQGWLFVNEATFWNQNRVQAFVTSVPLGRMIVLDLQSELIPQYGRLDSYFGQPFIWCMLHNFGGTLGLYGAAENINSGIFNARSMNGSTMVGIGLTPEGINQNYVVYDLVLDLTWRTEPVNLTLWFSSYVHRRYGHTTADVDKAWQFLKSGVYNFTGLRRVRGKYIICRRPTLRLKPWYWYNTTELKLAWDGFVNAASELGSSPLFQHDLVDVTRQALQVLGDGLYTQIVRGFQKKNLPFYQENVDMFLQLLEDINEILGTNKQFLLGVWLNNAKRRATYSVERIIYEFNARNQITLWGPLGEIRDYATKQWSGVVSDYYYPRWELFFDFLHLSLITKTPFNQTHFAIRVFETVEEPFTLDNSSYPDAPQAILPHMNNLPVSTTSDEAQTAAAKAVAQRLLNRKAALFIIKVNKTISHDNKDTFQVVKDTATGKVNITGSSGVSACWGLHHYLKHYCNCHISWDGDQLLLPEELPDISISVSALDLYRYYQNVVTTSYSFVWWDWNRWQREIDWMALNGINMALAFTGQEAIWERVYLKLNLTQKDIEEHFCGPAFLAWCRMGNIRGWGGPLLSDWHLNSLQLQHSILQSMRDLGILTILPAFAGHVPKAFKSPYLLEPKEPLFRRLGNMFINELIAEFGTDHFYNCDTFNEMVPQSQGLVYLRNVGAAIFEAISDVDPQAIWLLQGWLFVNQASFWNRDRVQAFVTSVPLGRMIVLDLQSELNPQYSRLDSYFGQPFIWCMLHNFGGTLGLYGAAENINSGIFNARSMNGSTMTGIGLTPEGINQNYVVFSSYAIRRYGHTTTDVDKAWQFLKSGVYNFTDLHRVDGQYIICLRPTLHFKPWYWYNTTELKLAWDGFVNAASELGSSPLFQHDLVDVTRQALQVLGDGLYTQIVRGFQKKNLPFYQENVDMFLQLLEDINEILGTNKQFLLGVWLNSAKRRATYSVERIIYEFNARNQITLWGPLGEIRDYATKQWSGNSVEVARRLHSFWRNSSVWSELNTEIEIKNCKEDLEPHSILVLLLVPQALNLFVCCGVILV